MNVLRIVGSMALGTLVAAGGAALISLLGVLSNWGFLAAVLLSGGTAMAARGASATGFLLFGLFGVVFPCLYALAGQHYGVRAGLRHVYRKHRDSLREAVIPPLARQIERAPELGRAVECARLCAAELSRQAERMPFPARMGMQQLLRGPVLGKLTASLEAAPEATLSSPEAVARLLATRLDAHLDEELLCPDPGPVRVLLAVNAAAAAAALYGLL